MNRYRWFALLLSLILIATFAPAQAEAPKPEKQPSPFVQGPSVADWTLIPLQARLKIDPRVMKQFLEAAPGNPNQRLGQPEMVTFLVYLSEQAPEEELARIASPAERREALVAQLQDTAVRSQSGIRAYLDERVQDKKVARYESFWIFNGLVVQGDLETATQLALRPEVEAIRPNRVHYLPQPSSSLAAAQSAWGVGKIGADRVWQYLGITGQGVVVANMDSGVDWTHPALQSKYRGYNPSSPDLSDHNYNWFDPTGTYPRAPGPQGIQYGSAAKHGTHTMGTLVGSEEGVANIGVAPGAQWIAVKIFDDAGQSTDEWIHKGFQWCLAPMNLDGLSPDPGRAPDILSNSWGDDNGRDQAFAQDLRALRLAGTMTVFSAGNNGPDLGTVGAPGSLSYAFAVGASDQSDEIAEFSSRGPSPWGKLKPEVVAPGVGILSAVPGGMYEGNWDGTSMAAPHVAGLAALIFQARRQAASQPNATAEPLAALTITATEYLITSTVVDLGDPGPDMVYGYGRVDAYQAVASVIESGSFTGRVTNSQSGAPIADAQVTMRNTVTQGQMATRTNADGSYAFAVAEGTYNVTASRFGYQDQTVYDIQVLAHTATQLDFTLARLPSGTIKGRVTKSSDGRPVTAHIQILGTPLQTTTDAQGYYNLVVPVGSYALQALPAQPGYRGSRVEGISVRVDRTTQANLTLSPAPRILLVDADAWVPESHIAYYATPLSNLLLSYDTWTIADATQNKPTAADLAPYDLVIWSQPHASPGYIDAWGVLSAYLDQGGMLFISGEDIGYFDNAKEEYLRYLNATYVSDYGGLDAISGIAGDIFAGIELDYNTPDSARNQISPDVIRPGNARGHPLQSTRGSYIFSLRGDSCVYRTIYLSYGLEGVGPATMREQLLEKAISWVQQNRPARAVGLVAPITEANATVDRTTETKVYYDVTITNDGASSTAFDIATDSVWPTRALDALTGDAIARTRTLVACESQALRIEVSVSRSAYAGEVSNTTLSVKAVGSPSVSATQTFRTRAMNAWSWGPSLAISRYRAASVAVGCAIYTVGGLDDGDNALSTLEILDPGAKSWREGAPKSTPAGNSAAVALGGRMYVLGGYDPARSTPHIDAVEIYDPASDTWTPAASLPKALSGIAAAVYGGKVYAFGGNDSNGESAQSYVYDPALDRWSTIASIPVSEASFARAVTLGDRIYLAGGWPAHVRLLRYDPASDSWSSLAPMNVGRHSFAFAAAADGHLYAAGGGNEWSGLASAEQYDPASDSWSIIPSLRNGQRAGTAGAYVDGTFHVIGGTDGLTTNRVEVMELDIPLNGSYLSVSAPYCRWDDVLDYRVTLRNPAGSPRHATWTHVLPVALTYVEGSASGGVRYDPLSRTLAWENDLAASSLLTLDFRARVGQGLPNDTVITSTIQLESGACSPRAFGTTTQLSMPLLQPRLSGKTVDKAAAAPGDRLHYTIRLANASPFGIPSASLVDAIPEGTTLVAGSVQGATYNASRKSVEWTGILPARPQDQPAFSWIDASSGQHITLGDDECTGPLDLGFVFYFYGTPYSQIYISSNGMLLFGQCNTTYSNAAIPGPEEPNNFIAPLWDDLTATYGRLYLATLGGAPQRYAVVTWDQVSFYGLSEQKQTFQVVLYEGTNRVILQYLDLNGERSTGSLATVGIENADGTAGVQYLYDGLPTEHALASRSVIEMTHSSSDRASFHLVSYDVVINEPCPPRAVISNTANMSDGLLTYQHTVTTSVDSPSFSGSYKEVVPRRARSGEELSYTLNISNSGSQPAIAIAVSDPLPPSMTFVEGSLSGVGARFNAAQRRIEWQGQMAPQESMQISYRAKLANNLAPNTWITNTAEISEQGVLMERLDAGVLANEINLGTSHKQADRSEAIAGTAITYTIILRNSGMVAAPNVAMTDTLPGVLNMRPGSLNGATYDPAARAIYWHGPLAPDEQHTVSFAVDSILSVASGARITNTATIGDGYGGSISKSAGLIFVRGDLSTSDMMVSPDRAMPGETVTYTLRVRNTGAVNTGANLSCDLPSPLAVVNNSAYASSGNVRVAGSRITWEGTVLNQGMVIVRFRARIPSDASPQALLTQATVVDRANLTQRFGATLYIGDYLLFVPILRR